jgi:(p)ppGpp synthase/HD superfamily hydrolase
MTVIALTNDYVPFDGKACVLFGVSRPTMSSAQAHTDDDAERPLLSSRFDEALLLASELHRLQRRKSTMTPYISHLLGVAALVLELGGDEDQAIAALLHDAVEDQGGDAVLDEIYDRFGGRVGRIVDDCTQREADNDDGSIETWRQTRLAYINGLAAKSSDSLLVSLCDKTHNARTIVDDLRAHGTQVWDRFHAGRDGTLWYYTALAAAFTNALPGSGSQRFARIVDELARDH